MPALADEIEALAADGFSGVVSVDRGGETVFAKAYGLADRAHAIPNRIDTQFATASGTKSLTALTVVSLVAEGTLELTTTARSVLGEDLPLIDERVTVEQLLAHRSGIGDYLDEETDLDFDEYLMPVPVQNLATTEQYLAVLDGYPSKFEPDARFAYCNSGYVVLALIAERASGVPYHDLVEQRVTGPAGMDDTRFLRSDELPARAALGYVGRDGLRTNVFHLQVRGNGDGGAYTTAADAAALWRALFAGDIVPNTWVAEMIRPRSDRAKGETGYGLGFWVSREGLVRASGGDTGVSFSSTHDPATQTTSTVLSNIATGGGPIGRLLEERLFARA
jgi:CubicO group peptidase (beta-lactamase class C family)